MANNDFGQNNSEQPVDYAAMYTTDPFGTSDSGSSSTAKDSSTYSESKDLDCHHNVSAAPEDSVYISGNSVYIGQESKVSVDSSSSIYGTSSESIYGSTSSDSIYGSSTGSIYGNYSTNPVYGEKTPMYQPYTDPSQTKDKLLPLAIIALIFGILGIFCNILSLWVFNIIAIILSVIYLCVDKQNPLKTHKSMAIAALVLGIVGAMIGVGLVAWAAYDDFKTSRTTHDYQTDDTTSGGYTDKNGNKIEIITDYDYSKLDNAPDEYSAIKKSDDPVINEYIDFFTDVAKQSNLSDSRVMGSTFTTSSSNCIVITMYNYPAYDSWTSFTISHYFNEDVYPFMAENQIKDKTEEYKKYPELYGEVESFGGDDYRYYTSVADDGYVTFYGIIPDSFITIEGRTHFKDQETKAYAVELYKSFKNGVKWPDIQ